METKRRQKWIEFKSKRPSTGSNLNKESNNRVIPNTEVEIAPVGFVSSNEDQQDNFPPEK